MSWQRWHLVPSSITWACKRDNAGHVSMTVNKIGIIIVHINILDIFGNRGPGMVVVPHIDQWRTTQTLPVRNQVTYDIVIVSAKGAMDTMLVSAANGGPETVADFCFGLTDTFSVVVGSTTQSIRQDVTPISGTNMSRLMRNGTLAWSS